MMRDIEVRRALSSLKATKTDSSGAAARSKTKMFDVFDSLEPTDDGNPAGPNTSEPAAEISLLVEPDRAPESRRWSRVWVPAAAAAALVFALLTIQRDVERFDPTVVAAADSMTDESAQPVDDKPDEDPDAPAPFVDDALPRLIEGSFSTTALSGTVSFVVDETVWLTRHETDLIELSRNYQDPLAARMVIARVQEPVAGLTSQSAIGYLTDQPPGVTGQVAAFVVDGAEALSWRGRVDPAIAGLEGCTPGEVCLTLFDSPVPIGLHQDVTNDVVERPSGDGDTFVFVAAIPVAEFGFRPFEGPFAELFATIEFNESGSTTDDE